MELKDSTIKEIALVESQRGEVSFNEIWEFWQKHHKAKNVIKLWDACNIYLVEMKEKEKMSKEHRIHVRKILETLCDQFGERLVHTITRTELGQWLDGLNFSAVTKKNYRSSVSAEDEFLEPRRISRSESRS